MALYFSFAISSCKSMLIEGELKPDDALVQEVALVAPSSWMI
jgi:hypothetical protein